MIDDDQFELSVDRAQTHVFIQWKGTDVCMDFRCECGEDVHIDGMFVYAIECSKCGVRWEMPSILFPRRTHDESILFVSTEDHDE